MALEFGGASGASRVNCGSDSVLDNIAAGTMMQWCRPDATTASRNMSKGTFPNNWVWSLFNSIPSLVISRATQSLLVEAASANFSAYALNTELCFAATWDRNGAAGDQQLWMGNLSTPMAEPSAYSTQRVGSGTFADDSGGDLIIGNLVAANRAFPGRISWCGIWNRRLIREELIAQQWNPHVTSGCVGFWVLGWNGTSTQPDLSGNANNGTVTSATVAAHVPLRPLYGGFAGWRGNFTAAAAFKSAWARGSNVILQPGVR